MVSSFFARIKTLRAVLDVDKLQQKDILPQLIVFFAFTPLDDVDKGLRLIRARDRNFHNIGTAAGFNRAFAGLFDNNRGCGLDAE